MKYRYLLILLAASLAFLPGCGTRTVAINTYQPAEIMFPEHVNTLLLVDRTKFKNGAVGILEGVLTGEMPGEDRAGLQEAMASLQRTLMTSPRFQVKMAGETLVGNSVTAAFPVPIDWGQVEALCSQYQADAIVAVEIFDTDFIVTDGKRRVKKKVTENNVQREVEVDEFYAQGIGNAKIGFRMYDPKTRSIVDQQLFTKSNTWEATGSSYRDAAVRLVQKTEATRYVSSLAGTAYARKIAPMPVSLTRQFYGKSGKTPQMAAGSRQADVNDWQGAISTWQSALGKVRQKDAGRLSYNIAVAYEVLGDMDNAKRWAQKAYVEFGNKKGRQYVHMLDMRAANENLVQQQLNEQ